MNALARAGVICTGLYLGTWCGWRAVAAEPSASPAARLAQFYSPARPVSVPASGPPPAPSQTPAAAVRWEILARSAEGRPIEFAQFGDGLHQVLVIGSLEGNKPEGVAIAELLAAHLARFPRRLGDVTVTIVRDPNPDGRARRTSANARGVELDRNFQTTGWRQAPAGRGASHGQQPESEPETRAVVELLADLKPQRVVLLATSAGRLAVSYAGPAETLARQAAHDAAATLAPLDAAQEPGSLLNYVGQQRGLPAVRFGLVPRATADAIWSELKAGLMTAIGCGSSVEFPKPAAPAGAVQTQAQPPSPPPADPPAGDPPSPPPLRQPIGELTASPRVVPSPAATGPGAHAARPAIGEAARAALPQAMPYQSVRQGVPIVRVVSPRAASGAVPSAPTAQPHNPETDSPAATPAATVKFVDSAPAAPPHGLERLPPVDTASATPRVVSKDLPQPPIPVYPSTGQ